MAIAWSSTSSKLILIPPCHCVGRGRPLSWAPFPIARGAVARHQVINDLVELLPRGLTVGMAAHDERRAGVKLLVLQVPAGEFRADQIPGQFKELHSRHSVSLRGLEVG